MKKLILTIIALVSLPVIVWATTNPPFNSFQVGSSPSNGYVLQTNGSVSTWVATSTLNVKGIPAGSNTQVQFNNNGAFGATGDFTFNSTDSTRPLTLSDPNVGAGNIYAKLYAVGGALGALSLYNGDQIAQTIQAGDGSLDIPNSSLIVEGDSIVNTPNPSLLVTGQPNPLSTTPIFNVTNHSQSLSYLTVSQTGLVSVATSTNSTKLPYTSIVGWGDSETESSALGGSDPMTASWGANLQSLTGYGFDNNGVSGEASANILARMQLYPNKWGYPSTIWAGRNDQNGQPSGWNTPVNTATTTIPANIQSMISLLTTSPKQCLLLSILNKNDGTESAGSVALTQILQVNATIQTTATNNGCGYFDVRGYLVSLGTGGEQAANIPASAYMIDALHPNPAGNIKIAQQIQQLYLSTLLSYPNGSVVTYNMLDKALRAPTTIGSALPNSGYFRTLIVNASTSPTGQTMQSRATKFFIVNGSRATDALSDYSDGSVPTWPLITLNDSYGTTTNEIRAFKFSMHSTGIGLSALGNLASSVLGDTGFGDAACSLQSTGWYNTCTGYGANAFNTSSNGDTSYGALANQFVTGGYGTGLGYSACQGILGSSAGSYNTCIGQNSNMVDANASGQVNIDNIIWGTGAYTGSTLSSSTAPNGKIGIGTTTPNAMLTVTGNASIGNALSSSTLTVGLYDFNDGVTLKDKTAGTGLELQANLPSINFNNAYNNGAFAIGAGYTGQFGFDTSTGNTSIATGNNPGAGALATLVYNAFVVRQNGNVGISTTTPYARLSVVGSSGTLLAVATSTVSNSQKPVFSVDTTNEIKTAGKTPIVSTCGTTPNGSISATSNDTSGQVTVGGGVVTACTVTYAQAKTGNTHVFVEVEGATAIASTVSAHSASAFTVTFAATLGSGVFDYWVVSDN